MDDALPRYLRDLQRRNLAPSTAVRRRNCVLTLKSWVNPRCLRTVTGEDIDLMLDHRRLCPRTRYTWISHLHHFFSWAVAHGYIPQDPTATIIRPRLPRLLPRPIADADLAIALDCADPAMRAWLTLCAFGGLRIGEVAKLERADLLPDPPMLLVHGKGNKDRLVPRHPDIDAALAAAVLPRAGRLWDITPARASRLVALHLQGLSIDATAHQLRHWFGTRLYQQTGDLRLVQELMGHASITTTAGYVAWHQPAGHAAVHALTV